MIEYLDYATERQKEYIHALMKHGSGRKAAAALGVSKSVLNRAISDVKRKAAKQGYSPAHDMTRTVPDGYSVKGVSTLYNADGVISAQWVKSTADQARQAEIQQAAFEAMAAELPKQEPINAPDITLPDLCNVYTITDAHVGALAWRMENLDPNGDWDLTIAEKTLTGCFEHMINASAAAKTGIVAQIGDFLHFDSLSAVTPTNGHLLDADGRFPKVVQAAIRILRRIVNMALARHDQVVVVMGEGNHDAASSVWLREMFKALYEDEPRLTVIDSVMPYYVYQHGETMLCWHHGHLRKPDQLPLLFAAQFPKVWGDTVKRYCHVGHRHHVEIKEHSGMVVEQHSTLAARDAYASRGGWFSERQCNAITYHTKFGQVAKNTITPEMLQ